MHSKTKPKTIKPKDEDKDQRERFIKAARAIGVDESGREFEKGLKRILPQKVFSKKN